MTTLITGAARGIGRACALRLAEGDDLVLLDVAGDLPDVPYSLGSAPQLAETAARCRDKGANVLTVTADVRDPEQTWQAVRTALERFDRIDVLVNNAGIAAPSGEPTHLVTEDQWATMFDINVSGAWRMIKAVAPGMVERQHGSIVNIASTAAQVGYRYFAGYVASKHALVGLSKAAALDYAPAGVRVNAICPGSVRDDPALDGRLLEEIAHTLEIPPAEHERIFVKDQPGNTLVEAGDVTGTVAWLASGESAHVTGSVVTVDGGFTAR